jgi:hypothetical protein
MTSTTDFIGTVYDTLAKLLSIDATSRSVIMQMAWPGYSLSPADFKPAGAPQGPYDSEVAIETFSNIANIAPALNGTMFENSGYEIDDIYEILIASAIPVGATAETLATNPINRLFSDAQYELMQARRGSKNDPNVFYYPCVATPNNWYDETATQFWPTIAIKSTDIKPLDPTTSVSAKLGIGGLVDRGVWKLKPEVMNEAVVKKDLQQVITSKGAILNSKFSMATTSPPIVKPLNVSIAAATARTLATGESSAPLASPIANPNLTLTPAFAANLATVRDGAILNTKSVPVNTLNNNSFKTSLQKISINKQNLAVDNGGNLNVAQRFLVSDLISQKFIVKQPSPETSGFSISFKFCRVNIDRKWFKLALLSTRNWYMYGTSANEYSTGTVTNNPGIFPLLPLSFIVISDLKITANWSKDDRVNLEKAISFGPFDVRNGTINQDTLEVKGLQIIAWISKLMPPLPPTQV